MEGFTIVTLPFDVEISKLCEILLNFICISTDHISSSISKSTTTPLEENTSTYSKKGVQ